MESVLSIVRQVPGDGFYGQILDNLKSKTDVIVSAAQNSDGQTTALLHALPLAQLSVATVGTGVLLSQQADHLVEAVFLSFANCARAFLLGADADQAKVVHKEGLLTCLNFDVIMVSFSFQHLRQACICEFQAGHFHDGHSSAA